MPPDSPSLSAAPSRQVLAVPPTLDAPLTGLTVLLVEDSRYASDALRLMCQRSGARIRRAETLAAAARHLARARPDVAIVDMGLPDGDGAQFLSRLAALPPPRPLRLATSGDPEAEAHALRMGAQGFLAKPFPGLAAFRTAILRHLPERAWLCAVPLTEQRLTPDPLALRDDLALAGQRLADGPDAGQLAFLRRFVAGLARSAGDDTLEAACDGTPPALAAAIATRLRAGSRLLP